MLISTQIDNWSGLVLAKQRQQTILEMLKKGGAVRTAALAEHFDVSDQTIRRDFWELEERGLVSKGHGGAVLVNYWTVPYQDRTVLRQTEKLAIARTAQELVKPGMTLALGPGTTTEALAHLLNGTKLEIITNSLAVARAMTEPESKVRLTGGSHRPSSELLVGDWAIENLETCFVDMSFIGVSGIDTNEGYTVTEPDEAKVLRQFIRIARTAVVLCDSSKFQRVGKASVAPLAAVHKLITDTGIPQQDLQHLRQRDIEVIVAAPVTNTAS
jgi:DeoR/GlpR family transcriptional regulator of sugar metabolism